MTITGPSLSMLSSLTTVLYFSTCKLPTLMSMLAHSHVICSISLYHDHVQATLKNSITSWPISTHELYEDPIMTNTTPFEVFFETVDTTKPGFSEPLRIFNLVRSNIDLCVDLFYMYFTMFSQCLTMRETRLTYAIKHNVISVVYVAMLTAE